MVEHHLDLECGRRARGCKGWHRCDRCRSAGPGGGNRARYQSGPVCHRRGAERRPHALIARVRGGADLATAADHGHADAGAGAEHQDGGVLELVEHYSVFVPFPPSERMMRGGSSEEPEEPAVCAAALAWFFALSSSATCT